MQHHHAPHHIYENTCITHTTRVHRYDMVHTKRNILLEKETGLVMDIQRSEHLCWCWLRGVLRSATKLYTDSPNRMCILFVYFRIYSVAISELLCSVWQSLQSIIWIWNGEFYNTVIQFLRIIQSHCIIQLYCIILSHAKCPKLCWDKNFSCQF